MKKFLLSLATLFFAVGIMSAEELTLSFYSTSGVNNYGFEPAYTDPNTKYIANGSSTTQGAITITLNEAAKTADAWRNWSDGLRAYGNSKKPTMEISVNGGKLTAVDITTKKAMTVKADVGTMGSTSATTANKWTGDTDKVTFTLTGGKVAVQVVKITYTGGTVAAVAQPKISCADNTVTITAAEGADIYYTTDGTEPTTASTKYTAPFAITANVTVKAIAVKGGETSAVASFDAKYEATYNGFESFIAAGKGTTGVVDGPLTVIYQNGQNLYMQDRKGYQTLVFGAAGKSGLTNGDNFKDLSATVGEYGKAVQLTNPTLGEALAKGAAIAPSEHGLDELAASMLHRYVKLSGVSITGAPGTKKANFSITDGETTVVGRNNFQIDVQDGENFTITGFVCVYNGALQIYPVTIEGGQVMETVETPVIAPEAGSVKAGTEVTITCATEGAVIFYTLDGTKPTAASTEYKAPFALTADATVSAIAVKEGMVDSKVATAAYTILAADENVYTFDFNLDGNAATLTDAKVEAGNGQKDYDPNNLEGVQFINGPVTMWIDAPSGSLPRWWGATDKAGVTYSELRFYKGNVLNVSVNTNGQKIQSISFPKGYGSNFPTADQLTFSVDNGTIDIASRSWTAPADKVVTEVTVTVAATTNCGAVQVVTVKDDSAVSGVENIEAADENAPVEYFNLQGVRVSQPAAGLYIVRQGNKVSKVLVK